MAQADDHGGRRNGADAGLDRAHRRARGHLVAFRKHTLLPLDDCLYALQTTIPHSSRSALHRCFQRHGTSRPPAGEDGQSPPKKKFKNSPMGYLHVDFAQVHTEEDRPYLFVAID